MSKQQANLPPLTATLAPGLEIGAVSERLDGSTGPLIPGGHNLYDTRRNLSKNNVVMKIIYVRSSDDQTGRTTKMHTVDEKLAHVSAHDHNVFQ